MSKLRFGRTRYFQPICILRRCGFHGGPAGYDEIPVEQHDVGPLIVRAIETGDPPLHRVEDMLDANENCLDTLRRKG